MPAWLRQGSISRPELVRQRLLANLGRMLYRWTCFIASIGILVVIGGEFITFVRFLSKRYNAIAAQVIACLLLFYLPGSLLLLRYCRISKQGVRFPPRMYPSTNALLGALAMAGYLALHFSGVKMRSFSSILTYYVMAVIVISIVVHEFTIKK